jgi:flagellum-specific peptidoglycan hydrolase FlgJ
MLQTNHRLLVGSLLVGVIGAALVIVATGTADAAGVSATVSVNGTLQVRSAPLLSAKSVGTVRNKQLLNIQCYTTGTRVRGLVRTNALWDRLATGGYLSDAYVKRSRSIPKCAASVAKPDAGKAKPVVKKPTVKTPVTKKPLVKPIVGTISSSDGSVNLRAGPSTTAASKGVLTNGMKVNLSCGVVGVFVNGTVRSTSQWDRTTANTYVSHAYVVTPTLKLCPGSNLFPTSTISATSAQFIAAAVPGAQLGWRQYGVPPSVTIAQAILESGWGRSGLSLVDKNFFGIKCFNGVHGTLATGCHLYKTQECTRAGACFNTTATFRTYATMARSFGDHGSFLRTNSRYKPAFAFTRNANSFVWTMWRAGYATDPNYFTKITGIMASNGLYRYDTWK